MAFTHANEERRLFYEITQSLQREGHRGTCSWTAPRSTRTLCMHEKKKKKKKNIDRIQGTSTLQRTTESEAWVDLAKCYRANTSTIQWARCICSVCNKTLFVWVCVPVCACVCVWAPGRPWQLRGSHLLAVTPGESNHSQTMESNDGPGFVSSFVCTCVHSRERVRISEVCVFSLQGSKWVPLYEHVQRGVAGVDRLSLLPGDRLTSPNDRLRRIDSMDKCGYTFLSHFPVSLLSACPVRTWFILSLYHSSS